MLLGFRRYFGSNMMTNSFFCCFLFFAVALLIGCDGSSGASNDDAVADTEPETGSESEATGVFNSALFSNDLTSQTEVTCTLENGSTTSCYELTFIANGAGDTEGTDTIGPFCPETIFVDRSESGMGVYDGPTNPGFQSLIDAAQNMDADGFDIVDEDGNINNAGGGDSSACLEMRLDSTLEVTYMLPVTPQLRSEPYFLRTIENIGFGLNGVPYAGDPPGVAVAESGIPGSGSGNIPSLDHCGGHADPSGYYHWHFVPQSMNTVLDAEEFDFTERYGITCSNSNIAFDEPSAFAGFAKDGHPIYGAFDSVDSEDTPANDVSEVDECNGHSHATDEFPDGIYHYHALESGAPNMPACLMGSFPTRSFSVQ